MRPSAMIACVVLFVVLLCVYYAVRVKWEIARDRAIAHMAHPPSPDVAPPDAMAEIAMLRQENAALRAELKACQSKPNVLPSERGDDPEDDPGR